MKFLVDLALIALFFVAYKLYGIYTAVSVTMLGYFLQFALQTLYQRKIDRMQLLTLGLVLLLGSTTLLLRDEMIFKWKPTVIYLIFAIAFYLTELMGKQSIMQRLAAEKLTLPQSAWHKLNWSWIVFFVMLAIANLVVAYSYNTDVWVNFKLFGLLGITLGFILGQAIFIGNHMKKVVK